MLRIDITKHLPTFDLRLSATTDARILGVVGSSGAGKTTLLNCVAGVMTPDLGEIALGNRTLVSVTASGSSAKRPRRQSLPPRLRGVGYVFQDALLFPHLTVAQNLRYGLATHSNGFDYDEVVHTLELRSLLSQNAGTLSGGEAKRVAIGRALLCGPEVLLLDEPLAGLDRRLARRTLSFLNRVVTRFDVPTIYVSHTLSDVLFLCDHTWVLSAGELIAEGRPRDVLLRPQVTDQFDLADLDNMFVARVDTSGSPDKTARCGTSFVVADQRLIASGTVPAGTTEALLSLHASDIMLARRRPEGISARNILPGRITGIERRGSRAIAVIDVGVEWLVLVTVEAIEQLELATGVDAFAIVKASAISVAI